MMKHVGLLNVQFTANLRIETNNRWQEIPCSSADNRKEYKHIERFAECEAQTFKVL